MQLLNIILLCVFPEIRMAILFFQAVFMSEKKMDAILTDLASRGITVAPSMGIIVVISILLTIAMLSIMHIANYFGIMQFFFLKDILGVSYVYMSLTVLQLTCINNQLVKYRNKK